jgi:uncharacterized protein (DUF736 family)
MPTVGKMEEVTDSKTGEVLGWNLSVPSIREVGKCEARVNERAADSESAPQFVIYKNRNEFGAMWQKGPDRAGNPFFEIKLNGYPLKDTVFLRCFATDNPEIFEVNYSAKQSGGAG